MKSVKRGKIRSLKFERVEYFRSFPEYVMMKEFFLSLNPECVGGERSLVRVKDILDKFKWRASKNIIFYNRSKGQSHFAELELCHEVVHILLNRKFGFRLKGRPHYTLLCEAMASCSELYFKLLTMSLADGTTKSKEKDLSPTVDQWFPRTANSDKEHREFVRFLLEEAKEPFNGFKKATLEMFHVYERLMTLSKSGGFDRANQILKFHKEISSLEYFRVILKYDLGNNLLFVTSFCHASSAEDRRLVNQLRSIIINSNSWVEMLDHIEFDKKRKIAKLA